MKNGIQYAIYWRLFLSLPKSFVHRSWLGDKLHLALLRLGWHLHPACRSYRFGFYR